MLKEREKVFRQATILFDVAVVAFSFICAYFLTKNLHRFYSFDIFPGKNLVAAPHGSVNDHLVVLVMGVVVWCAALYVNGMYRSMRLRSLPEILWIIIKSAVVSTVALGALIFLFKYKFVSRFVFFSFFVIGACLLAFERSLIYLLVHYVRRHGMNYRRLLVVGTGKRAAAFIDMARAHPEWGLQVMGIIDDEGGRGNDVAGASVIGGLEEISSIAKKLRIDEVYFVVPRSRLHHIESAIYDCETLGVKTAVALDLFDLQIAQARHTDIDGWPFITFDTTPTKEWALLVKAVLDVLASGIGIVLLSPVFLAVALLIKATSPGPVFYVSKRIGLNGRRFVMYKFRTMKVGAHRMQKEYEKMNEMGGPVFKIKNDPRVTPVGRFLRKTSLDELPQLFNVFLGDMSIVGPRPPVQKEVLKYESWQRRRLSMKPGITCLWQVRGRNTITDFNEWMNLDLEYIDDWSLGLDFRLFLETIPVVLFRKGAC